MALFGKISHTTIEGWVDHIGTSQGGVKKHCVWQDMGNHQGMGNKGGCPSILVCLMYILLQIPH